MKLHLTMMKLSWLATVFLLKESTLRYVIILLGSATYEYILISVSEHCLHFALANIAFLTKFFLLESERCFSLSSRRSILV